MSLKDHDDDKTFDIYHVFSRWDFWLLIAVIIGAMLLLLYLNVSSVDAPA